MSIILKTIEFQLPNNLATLGKLINLGSKIKTFYRDDVIPDDLDFLTEGKADSAVYSLYNERRELQIDFLLHSSDNFEGGQMTCRVNILYTPYYHPSGDSEKQAKKKVKSIAGLEKNINEAFRSMFAVEAKNVEGQ